MSQDLTDDDSTFHQWLDAIRQLVITWADVDLDLYLDPYGVSMP